MMNWIKQNLVLVAGIVLPVLLVVGFLVLERAPRALADPPRHDFVVVAYRYDAQHPRNYQLTFEVRNGQLEGQVTPNATGQPYPNRQHADIFRYSAADNVFNQITFELPDDLEDMEDPVTCVVKEVSSLHLDKTRRSPDGYVFEYAGYGGRGGLLGELFGMGRRYDSYYVLRKDGAEFNLPNPAVSPYYYGRELHFMAWVTGGDGPS